MMNLVMFFAEEEPVVSGMSGALANLGTVMQSVITMIEGNVTLFTMFVVPLLGAGIGLVKRII